MAERHWKDWIMLQNLGGNLIIVVNDNDMSIAENHGGLYQNLKTSAGDQTARQTAILFRAMGLDYIYVNEGNNTAALIEAFTESKRYRPCQWSYISIR